MNHEPDLASRVVGTIQERAIAPRPRWVYAVQNGIALALLAVSVILGALTVATAEFLLVDRDWDLVTRLGQRNTYATLQSLPYLWLTALGLLVIATYWLVTRTRRGYRFAPLTALGGSVALSLALGSGLYAAGIGPRTHELARVAVPAYERLVISRDRFWHNPDQGLLGGIVAESTTTEQFLLRDAYGALWLVTVSGDATGVLQGSYVRIIGARAGTSTFAAETVLPWEGRQVATTTGS